MVHGFNSDVDYNGSNFDLVSEFDRYGILSRVEANRVITVQSDYQYNVHQEIVIEGEVIVEGELVVFD